MKGLLLPHWKKEVALADLSRTFPLVADILTRPMSPVPQDAIHAEVIHRHRGALFYREVMNLPLPISEALPDVLAHLSQRWLGTVAATPRGYALLIRFRAGHRGPDGYVSIVDGPGLDGEAISQRVMELLNQAQLSPFERTSLLKGWDHQVQ
ncbi:hypothetical protein IHN59_04180 [Deinococcus sp. 23YEL01]|nr:hypothetical protein [Deinococcus sp. 23YEL01]